MEARGLVFVTEFHSKSLRANPHFFSTFPVVEGPSERGLSSIDISSLVHFFLTFQGFLCQFSELEAKLYCRALFTRNSHRKNDKHTIQLSLKNSHSQTEPATWFTDTDMVTLYAPSGGTPYCRNTIDHNIRWVCFNSSYLKEIFS